MSRPFAAFDIDGTVLRWQLYHAVADEMVRRDLIDRNAYQRVKDARMTWKKRSHAESFDAYEQTLVTLIGESIKQVSVSAFEAACDAVIDEYKDQVYTYTRDLIQELRTKNYLLFAISGSQVEIVEKLARHYGFDDWGGTVYEQKNGFFTGDSQPLRSHRKPEYLQELVAKHGATWQGSLAVGDSESDIPMLSIVEQPIAFNPSRSLFDHASRQAWQIIVERKNMIYRLEPRDGSYVLA
jgi:HAD superfamily hydrolase (TIGR01490 family)